MESKFAELDDYTLSGDSAAYFRHKPVAWGELVERTAHSAYAIIRGCLHLHLITFTTCPYTLLHSIACHCTAIGR
jgi:hypothetical protein